MVRAIIVTGDDKKKKKKRKRKKQALLKAQVVYFHPRWLKNTISRETLINIANNNTSN